MCYWASKHGRQGRLEESCREGFLEERAMLMWMVAPKALCSGHPAWILQTGKLRHREVKFMVE